MSLFFVFGWAITLLFLGLCAGVAVKLWNYGVRGIYLLFSPLIVLFVIVSSPFIGYWIIFHFDKFENKLNEARPDKSSPPIKVPGRKRFMLALDASLFVIQNIPLLTGFIAKIIGKSNVTQSLSQKFFSGVVNLLFTAGDQDEKLRRRYGV